MKTIKTLVAVLAAAALTISLQCQAQVIIGNLPVDGGGQTVYDDGTDLILGNGYWGFGFTMKGAAYNMDNVKLDVTANGGNPVVELWSKSGSGNYPGSLITSSFTISGAAGNITADATSNPLLAANTTYYVVVKGASATSESWDRNTGDPAYNEALATFLNLAYYPAGGGWNSGTTFSHPGIEINAVPEPQAYAMMVGLGLLGFAAIRRKIAAK